MAGLETGGSFVSKLILKRSIIQDLKEKHAIAVRKDEKFYHGLTWLEEARKDQRLRRDRFNAAILKNVDTRQRE